MARYLSLFLFAIVSAVVAEEPVITGRIDAAFGCLRKKFKQLNIFLTSGEAEVMYKNVELIMGTESKSYLTIFADGVEQEKILLDEYDDRKQLHNLMAEKGFQKKPRKQIEKDMEERHARMKAEKEERRRREAEEKMQAEEERRRYREEKGLREPDPPHLLLQKHREMLKEQQRQRQEAAEAERREQEREKERERALQMLQVHKEFHEQQREQRATKQSLAQQHRYVDKMLERRKVEKDLNRTRLLLLEHRDYRTRQREQSQAKQLLEKHRSMREKRLEPKFARLEMVDTAETASFHDEL